MPTVFLMSDALPPKGRLPYQYAQYAKNGKMTRCHKKKESRELLDEDFFIHQARAACKSSWVYAARGVVKISSAGPDSTIRP